MSERDFEIINESISSLNKRRDAYLEKHLCYIDELAHALAEEAGEEEIFFRDRSFIERYFSVTAPYTSDCADFNAELAEGYNALSLLYDKGVLCTRLCDILGITGIMSVSTFFDESEEGDGSICYVKSPYADTAYLSFAKTREDARALYYEDFTQVCEDVYYGRSTYCILPISNSKDGRLGGFRNLVTKYSLITVQTVKVQSQDTETLFALMKRDLEIPKTADGAFFEFRLPSKCSLGSVLTVARACSMEATSVDMRSDGDFCDIVLKVNDEGICGLLAYLSLEHPDFVPLGIYKEI